MKQILAILTLIASLTFTSCEDFLTEEVRGQQNLDTYFQSVEEAESFITGCYQAITFGGWWNINTVWLLSEMYNPQNEMFRLLGTKRSFSQNETFFFSHPYPPYPALFRLISHF